jgi:hypothetical protein
MVTNSNAGARPWYGRLFQSPLDGRQQADETPDRLRMALPSGHDGFDFHADFRFAWRWQPGQPRTVNPLLALHEHLSSLGAEVSRDYALTHHAEVEDLIRLRLGCPQWVTHQIVLVRVDEFTLRADEVAAHRIAAHEAEWHHGQLRMRLLEEEVRELDFMRQAILGDSGRARSWWLKRHPEDLRTISDGTFDEIAARVTHGTAPPGPAGHVATIVHELLHGLDPSQTDRLLVLLERVLRELGRHDLAMDVRPFLAGDAAG